MSYSVWMVRYWIAMQDDVTIRKLMYKDVGRIEGIPPISGV